MFQLVSSCEKYFFLKIEKNNVCINLSTTVNIHNSSSICFTYIILVLKKNLYRMIFLSVIKRPKTGIIYIIKCLSSDLEIKYDLDSSIHAVSCVLRLVLYHYGYQTGNIKVKLSRALNTMQISIEGPTKRHYSKTPECTMCIYLSSKLLKSLTQETDGREGNRQKERHKTMGEWLNDLITRTKQHREARVQGENIKHKAHSILQNLNS